VTKKIENKWVVSALFLAMILSGPAVAEDLGGFDDFGGAVDEAVLDSSRGMALPETEDDPDFDGIFLAISEGNSAESDGEMRTNVISDTAFAGASGVATVIQNAGDNVIIQTATIVNVSFVND